MPEEKNETNKFASCNGFPKSVSSSIIKCAFNKSIIDNHTDDDNNTIKFYLTLPYFGRAGEILVKKCIIRMLKKNIEKDARVSFVVSTPTQKIILMNWHILTLHTSFVVLGVLKVILVKRKEPFLKK